MKTTLNLGSFNIDLNNINDRFLSGRVDAEMVIPQNTTAIKVDIKDVSITLEASVEETLEDIKATVEIIKEMKSLGSEVANLFAGLESKRQERREQSDRELQKENFDKRFDEIKQRIDATTSEITKDIGRLDRKADELESAIAVAEQKMLRMPRDN